MDKQKFKRFLILLCITNIISLLMLFQTVYFNNNLRERISLNYTSIPSHDEINNFCKDKGYRYGWLSSSEECDRGINCNKEVIARDTQSGEITKYIENKCFN